MSDNEQKPGKILRTSSGRTRLTASGGSEGEESGASEDSGSESQGSAPSAPEAPPSVPEAPGGSDVEGGPGAGSGPGVQDGAQGGPTQAQVIPEAPAVPAPTPASAVTGQDSDSASAGPAGSGGAGVAGSQGSGPQSVGAQGRGEQSTGEQDAGAQVWGAAADPAPGSGPGSAPWSGSQTEQQGAGVTKVSSASKGMRLTASSAPEETRAQPAVGSGSQFGSGPGAAGSEGLLPGGNVKTSSGGVKMKGKGSKKGPRTVRLTAANIDPWSVMKMSFLLSLAIAIAMLVATLVLWLVLQATGVIGTVETTLEEIAGAESAEALVGLISLGRVMATAFVLGLVNIVLMTALSTLFAFLYNIGASIVGGFHLTLTDE